MAENVPSAPEAVLAPEWLDRPDLSPRARRRAIADLRRVNGLLFGRRAAVRAVLDELAAPAAPPRRERSVREPGEKPARFGGERKRLLDVAAGSGDVGAAAMRAARRRGVRLDVVALDLELAHLLLGRRWGEIDRAVVARAEALPFADRTFELALSSLFFHHLDRGGKIRVGAEMLRVCRRSAVIVDLARSRWAAAAVRLLFPLLAIGRVAREDGLVSIARAWNLDEWRRFLAAGLSPLGEARVRRRFPARVTVVLRAPSRVP